MKSAQMSTQFRLNVSLHVGFILVVPHQWPFIYIHQWPTSYTTDPTYSNYLPHSYISDLHTYTTDLSVNLVTYISDPSKTLVKFKPTTDLAETHQIRQKRTSIKIASIFFDITICFQICLIWISNVLKYLSELC